MSNVVALRKLRGGAAANLPHPANDRARYDISSASLDTDFAFIGSDAWGTSVGTGAVVPAAASDTIGGARYLFLLARASFGAGQRGTKLVGIRQYADMVARFTSGLVTPAVFHKEIVTPLWHPPDGSISWHVMVIDKTWRDTRNPLNADSLMFQDAQGTALLYQTLAPYVPPNGGIPWGTPIDSSLGNMHELRYPYRTDETELQLRVEVPVPCDVALFASVRQNDPLNTQTPSLSANQFTALSPEDQFLYAFPTLAQYGRIAGSLVFEGDDL